MQTITFSSAKRKSSQLTVFALALLVVGMGITQPKGSPPVNAGPLLEKVER